MSAIPIPMSHAAAPMDERQRSRSSSCKQPAAATCIEKAIAARCKQLGVLAHHNERDAHELRSAKDHLTRLRRRIGTLEQRLANRGRQGFLLAQECQALEDLRVAKATASGSGWTPYSVGT